MQEFQNLEPHQKSLLHGLIEFLLRKHPQFNNRRNLIINFGVVQERRKHNGGIIHDFLDLSHPYVKKLNARDLKRQTHSEFYPKFNYHYADR